MFPFQANTGIVDACYTEATAHLESGTVGILSYCSSAVFNAIQPPLLRDKLRAEQVDGQTSCGLVGGPSVRDSADSLPFLVL